MDSSTYDQLHVPADTVGDAANFLLENQDAIVAAARGDPALRRAADVGRAGDHLHRAGPAGRPLHRRHQARDASRPATRSQVPLFLETGTKVKVDTRDGRLPRPGQRARRW